jgi:Mrp family chromosome partitioning ATPase
MSKLDHASTELCNLTMALLARPRAPTRDASTPGRSIFISSARAGEGKTFIASAIARFASSFTEERVLLVDANFERPALHERFEVAQGPGLSEMIEAGGTAGIAPLESSIPNLFVLPAGLTCKPALLFRHIAVRTVLAQLGASHGLVIVDGGTTRIAGSLPESAGGLILVADCQTTRREAAAGALARLRLPPEKVLGAVLNRKEHHIPAMLYRHL